MKARAISFLLFAEVAVMSLWFVSAAILPDMLVEHPISPFRQAALSSGVQIGFVIGALMSAFLGIADRFDPRKIFAISAMGAGLLNLTLLIIIPGSAPAILVRIATGFLLAGVYPVGMKIAIGWGDKDRGFLIGALVGALTLGTAIPHLISLGGGTNWRITLIISSLAAMSGGIIARFVTLGPHHAIAPKFNPKLIAKAWTDHKIRLAYAGYLGHMWELYAMWAWVGLAVSISYAHSMPVDKARFLASLTAFIAIGSGAIASIFAGRMADKIGKAEVTIIAMALSGTAALATALTFGGPVWLTFIIVVFWGITIIPDSAQFSAIIADVAPPEEAGSLMTFQTALGFALTFVTVQITPGLAAIFGWPLILVALALGPAFGIIAMLKLRSLP